MRVCSRFKHEPRCCSKFRQTRRSMQPMCTTLANAATPYGEILSAARRDGPDFVRRCVTRRSFGITKFLSSRLAAHKIWSRRGHV